MLLVLGVVGIVAKRLDTPSYPSDWDPRVVELVAFVERERGLRFEHPVHIDFLSPADYSSEVTTAEEDLTDADRAELDQYASQLRAVGLVSGELDLFAAFNQVSDGGTLAYYDPATDRVTVRGTEITVGLQVTLVHELTHALQDQHFDLERVYDDDLDASASVAFLALVEGDATWVENVYIDEELTDAEQDEYFDEYEQDFEDSEAALQDVPAYMLATFGLPYVLGEPLVTMLHNDGGNRAVNRALEDPPHTEEHLFDPASFLASEAGAELDLELDDDLDVYDEGPFGSPTWYLMLAERIDPMVAFEAALGWDGDYYVAFERDGRSCMRAAFAGDDADDEAEMVAALEAWSAALPEGQAETLEIGGHPGFESCDPGVDVDLEVGDGATEALLLPSLWGYLVADAAIAVDADEARCYARRVIGSLTFDEIVDPEGTAFGTDEFMQSMQEAISACAPKDPSG